jgi:nucleotide-binding universal stress UspA family protein
VADDGANVGADHGGALGSPIEHDTRDERREEQSQCQEASDDGSHDLTSALVIAGDAPEIPPESPGPARPSKCMTTRRTAMAKRILVPLDRDETSTAVLPIVADIARSSGATVRLLHVAPIPEERVGAHGRIIAYASQEMERIEHDRRHYLKEAEARLEGVPAEAVVRFGDPVEEILREADAFDADLVAVTAEDRGWLGHLLGGVADRVFHKAEVPVIVLGTK